MNPAADKVLADAVRLAASRLSGTQAGSAAVVGVAAAVILDRVTGGAPYTAFDLPGGARITVEKQPLCDLGNKIRQTSQGDQQSEPKATGSTRRKNEAQGGRGLAQ